MQFTDAFLATSFLAFISTVRGASVNFYNSKEATCSGSPSMEYRNLGCNTCIDPPGDWWGAQVFDISDNQRVSMHNEDKCTPASQVGQWYGNTCATAGNTALRSVWIACAGQRRADETSVDVEESRADKESVTFISLE
ncbi:hypothetical protein BDQ17DRAFT_1550771 [Cyathus striatus]|nr:hypothetical protein BDQ17DRAFT_1550771 [Cyathus striatus]